MSEFSYSNIIKTPAEMKSGTKSNQLGANISALKGYSSLLLTSDSTANSLRGHALGNQTWVPTNTNCVDSKTGISKKRYIYIDNQPSTNTPPDKNATTANFEFNGLLPGMIDDIFNINPMRLFAAFTEDGIPKCQYVALSTTDKMSKNTEGDETEQYVSNYISEYDLKNVSGCSFQSGVNPYSNHKCPFHPAKESFKNISKLPKDNFVRLYFTTLAFVSLYILYCLIKKHK